MAERWYERLSKLLAHELSGRQPLILYASHPHFQQTNVIESMIGEGTGGVTEGLRRRIVLPLGATLAQSDHVIGHELVHAFQYDILGLGVNAVPLWFIEGMAEYLSIGPRDPQTAMWLRDAAIEDKLPAIDKLDDPDYFPYRWGQAFWAYIGGRWGDDAVGAMLRAVGSGGNRMGGDDPLAVIERATGMEHEALTAEWHAAIREMYGATAEGSADTGNGRGRQHVVIGGGEDRATMNVGPALSPDGTRIAFLSERSRLSIDLYLADATNGQIIRKLISTAVDPHFQSLQFLMSAGTWNPNGRELAVAAVRQGYPVLAIVDTERGRIAREIPFRELDEIFQPAWAPDGRRVAFAGQSGGVTDLYVHDLQSGQTTQLTKDVFADLQRAWSPDGSTIAFVSDRFSTNADTLAYGRYTLAVIEPGRGSAQRLGGDIAGNQTNPHWLPDGSTVAFISDATGRPEVYAVDRASGRISRVASARTGVAGITPLSPALAVAAKSERLAYSVFRDRGFDLHITDWPGTIAVQAGGRDLAQLPPANRRTSTVASLLSRPAQGLVSAGGFTAQPYRARLSLIDIGQQIGVASSGPFGSYVSGGIALTFSDVLGNHLVGTSFGVNGGLADASAQGLYVDRRSRWNWGVFGDRVPFLSGTVAAGFVQQDGQVVYRQDVDRLRQTYHQAGGFAAYPFSQATRVEFSATAQHIGFDREIRTTLADPVTGFVLDDFTTKLPTASSLTLFGTGAALIRDTAVFGVTGPLAGQRMHLDVMPTWGDLQLVNVTADFRQYFMPEALGAITFAGRLLHVGRYGGSGEDQRLLPLFLGYPELVRGYGIGSFDASECPPAATGCPIFDSLVGSRMVVVNAEIRAPLVGLFRGRLDYGQVPVDVFAFADAGVAWMQSESPAFAGGTRQWVKSVGGGARVNLLGFAVAELNMVRPIDRPGRGWIFVFNLRPGW
jgi:hypothetical protein